MAVSKEDLLHIAEHCSEDIARLLPGLGASSPTVDEETQMTNLLFSLGQSAILGILNPAPSDDQLADMERKQEELHNRLDQIHPHI